MSISQNFPSTRPSLNLNFARSQKLDPRITFTRSSSATYTGGDGLIKIAATDTPRFDFNATTGDCLGLLIEESRSNLVTYSEQFDDASWTKTNAGITTNTSATTAPNGTNSAEKLSATAVNGEHLVYKTPSLSSSTYTLSVFAKSAGYNFVGLRIDGPSLQRITLFDLSTGTIGGTSNVTSSSITPYSNGWYRCSITVTDAVNNYVFPIFPTNSNVSYTGDGTSGIYLWGAQLEAGSFPTSYIPTVASTVTRSADNASITGTNFSSFYNPTEGTLGFIGDTISPSSYSTIYQIDDGGTNNRLYLDKNSSNGRVVSTVSGSNQCLITLSTISSNTLFKLYGAYKLNDCAGSFNGGTVGTDTSATMPTCNMSRIGTDGVNYINGRIAKLSYYPVRLSNSQLQSLTK